MPPEPAGQRPNPIIERHRVLDGTYREVIVLERTLTDAFTPA
jgi:hypothetical protein